MQIGTRSVVRVFEQTPSQALGRFIKRFLVVEFTSLHRDIHLPDAGAVVAFSFGGNCLIDGKQWAPPAAFTGPRDKLRSHEHSDGQAVLLATFTPVGANAFLRQPLNEFAGLTTDLGGVIGRPAELERLQAKLAKAPNHRQRIELLESFLLARIRISQPDPLIAAAITWLGQGLVAKRIEDLTRYIGLSQSALERRFRRIVGMSPKQYASLVRLRHAVQLQANGLDLTTVAHTAGYFDQSHFIKDFRRATGSAPAEFFRLNSME